VTTRAEMNDAAAGEPLASLLRRWFVGRDRDALDELLRRNLDFLQRYAHAKLSGPVRSKEDTGDLVQEAVLDFMHYAPPFEVHDEAHLRGLLCRIVDSVLAGQHRWFSRMRRDLARERPIPEGTSVVFGEPAAPDRSPSRVFQASEREAALRLAIATLEPLDQKIVYLRTYADLPFPAIATEVQLSAEAVRKRFDRALPRLSRKLGALQEGRVDEFFE